MKRRIHINVGVKNTQVVQSSPVDEFYCDEVYTPQDKQKAKCYTNPLYLLLNQKRIESMGTLALEQWLSQFNMQKPNPLAELRSKCTDADLIKMIKSRHLQTPSEILAWSHYVKDHMSEFSAELESLVAEQEAINKDENKSTEVETKSD